MMHWTKPRNASEWLLLFSPTVAAFMALWIVPPLLPPILSLHLPNGLEIANSERMIARGLSLTFYPIMTISLAVALIFTRDLKAFERLGQVLLLTVFLVVLNAFVAFSGCALFSAVH